MPAGWFLFLLLVMQFWPLQWSPYIPIHRLPRFLHVAAIPGALVIGGGLSRLMVRGGRWRLAIIATATLYAGSSFLEARRASAYHDDCMRDSRLIADFVDWYDGPVVTDAELHHYLVFSEGFSDAERFRAGLDPSTIPKGSLVIVGGSRRPELDPFYAIGPEEIPRGWVRVFQLKTPMGRCRIRAATGYVVVANQAMK